MPAERTAIYIFEAPAKADDLGLRRHALVRGPSAFWGVIPYDKGWEERKKTRIPARLLEEKCLHHFAGEADVYIPPPAPRS